MWRTAVAESEARGFRVLVAAPAQAEAHLSFAGSSDLEPALEEILPALPPPQRAALEATLLLTGHDTFVMVNGVSTVESSAGTDQGDNLTGNGKNNKLYGEAGNDSLTGLDGNDVLFGAAGNDAMDGGSGTDRCVDNSGTNTRTSCESSAASPTDTALPAPLWSWTLTYPETEWRLLVGG